MEAQEIRFMLRIAFCILCIYQAQKKNRSMLGWGIFGFVLPLVANIWIACLKVHQNWEENPEIDPKKD